MNLPALTPVEKKILWFVVLCAAAGSILCLTHRSPASSQAGMDSRKAVIRDRIVKADHAAAPRNRTGIELDLNQATEQELARVPAMGPALAHFVVQDRSAHGPYASVEDLARVRGIAPSRLKTLSAYLYVLPESLQASAVTQSSGASAR